MIPKLPAYAPVDYASSGFTHLIMVAGHAIYVDPNMRPPKPFEEDAWFLEDYQKRTDLPATILTQMWRAVELARTDPHALLVFSGGQTRPGQPPLSEGTSYWQIADVYAWFASPSSGMLQAICFMFQRVSDLSSYASVRARTLTEEVSRDSLENLLFSIARFRGTTGRYPEKITVVGFAFKGPRFVDLHRAAIRYPESRFSYIGIDSPDRRLLSRYNAKLSYLADAPEQLSAQWMKDPETRNLVPVPPDLQEKRRRGEWRHAVRYYRTDPFGCMPEGILQRKREGRNPYQHAHGYGTAAPELAGLMTYCGPAPYPASLPWDTPE